MRETARSLKRGAEMPCEWRSHDRLAADQTTMNTRTEITEAKAKAIREEPRFSGIFPKGGKFERRIPLSAPVLHGEETDYIEKALATGADGSTVLELEKEIAEYMNKDYAAALSSGSAAIFMALKLAEERGYGNQVFCSDFAPVSLADAILLAGCEPIFIDVSYDDWCMEPKALEQAFKCYPDVRIVLMNHAYGYPGQVVEIKRICEAHGAILIEDASESFGARCFSSLTGTIGDIGILDFGTDRIITGLSGGILLTNDADDYKRVKHLAYGALTSVPWQQHDEAGYDFGITDLTAAMIRAQFGHLEDHIEKKREIYERYRETFEDSGLLEMHYFDDGKEPNYWMLPVTCESGIQFSEKRSETGYTYTDQHGTASPMEICDALNAFGAEARPVYKPLSMQPAFQQYDLITADGISHELFQTALCLPCDVNMTEKEQDTIIEIILSCFDEKNLDREAWEEALGRIS